MQAAASCPCCGNEQLRVLKTYTFANPKTSLRDTGNDPVRERLGILFNYLLDGVDRATFELRACEACGFCFTDPRMTSSDVEAKYRAIAERDATRERYRKKPATRLDARASRIRTLLLESGFRPGPDRRMLDVGGAWGYCLLPFVGKAQLFLVDYEKWELAPGITYLGRSIADVPGSERFDCILFLHTLEHVPDPRQVVQALAQRLTDDGYLYIEVPLGVFWEMTHLQEPITHVNFFSEESLFNLARSLGLHVASLATGFQWITNGRQWCVNIVLTKQEVSPGGRVPRATRRQRHGASYFLLAAFAKLARRLGIEA
jgi:SAM-dependent methyltransferase